MSSSFGPFVAAENVLEGFLRFELALLRLRSLVIFGTMCTCYSLIVCCSTEFLCLLSFTVIPF